MQRPDRRSPVRVIEREMEQLTDCCLPDFLYVWSHAHRLARRILFGMKMGRPPWFRR